MEQARGKASISSNSNLTMIAPQNRFRGRKDDGPGRSRSPFFICHLPSITRQSLLTPAPAISSQGTGGARVINPRWQVDNLLSNPPRPCGGQSAFSLIEIMVAVSLLAIIIVGLLAMFYQTQRAFRSSSTQMDVMEGGRAAVQLLNRELQEMISTGSQGRPNAIFAEDKNYTSGPQLPSTPAILQNISFVIRNNDDWKIVAYHATNPSRATTNVPAFTFSRFVFVTNAAAQIVADILDAIGSPRKGQLYFPYPEDDPGVTLFHRVLDGVTHFVITPFTPEGAIDMAARISNQWLDFLYTNSNPETIFTNPFPAALDLELGVLEPRALDKFQAKLRDNPQSAFRYLTNQAASIHLFRQRIPIRSTP